MVQAVNMALCHALEEDSTVVVFGEDVGINGGVFRATENLYEKFGASRVLDTPLSENLIAGISVGMSAAGLRPVGEIQFMGFIYPAMDQLECHASRLRNRTRGRLQCPMVLRAPYGGGVHAPEHHSESRESLFAHIPGLRVVIPSSPARAYGLLLSAIRCNDPVIFLEPKRLYRSTVELVENDGGALPLDQNFILREGSDISLVTWGAMVSETIQAAQQLAENGIEAEVIDVAILNPFDPRQIIQSVEKTGRCLIIHEASRTAGFGAEIAATVAEHNFLSLFAPIRRLGSYDTVIPLARLENNFFPDVTMIVDTATSLMAYT
jgi:pyruvate dehydrogenase E1 component beta subunit